MTTFPIHHDDDSHPCVSPQCRGAAAAMSYRSQLSTVYHANLSLRQKVTEADSYIEKLEEFILDQIGYLPIQGCVACSARFDTHRMVKLTSGDYICQECLNESDDEGRGRKVRFGC